MSYALDEVCDGFLREQGVGGGKSRTEGDKRTAQSARRLALRVEGWEQQAAGSMQ